MSIPGLGQIPAQPTASSVRTITLQPFWEWRFAVPHGSSAVTVRLVGGTAERDGTELAPNQPYTFSGTKSNLRTWHGCTLEVAGTCDDEKVAEYWTPEETPALSYLNLHFALQTQRKAARQHQHQHQHRHRTPTARGGGPRVLVCGAPSSGKTTVAKTLVALATKAGEQPVLVNADPRDAVVSLPGTLSAEVFGTIMDIEAREGGVGVGSAPSSGPSAVPVKLPLTKFFGRERPEDDLPLWRDLVDKIAECVDRRMESNAAVAAAGVIVDAPPVDFDTNGMEILAHVIRKFHVNVVVVLGSAHMHADLQSQLVQQTTKYGEAISVIMLEKSSGVVGRDQDKDFLQQSREAAIKEYFFGDSKRTLNPITQFVPFEELSIYTSADESDQPGARQIMLPVEASPDMTYSTLAIMLAPADAPPEEIRRASVMGFVYFADVDVHRRRVKVLAPMSGRLGSWALVWGKWPEACIGLLG